MDHPFAVRKVFFHSYMVNLSNKEADLFACQIWSQIITLHLLLSMGNWIQCLHVDLKKYLLIENKNNAECFLKETQEIRGPRL